MNDEKPKMRKLRRGLLEEEHRRYRFMTFAIRCMVAGIAAAFAVVAAYIYFGAGG